MVSLRPCAVTTELAAPQNRESYIHRNNRIKPSAIPSLVSHGVATVTKLTRQPGAAAEFTMASHETLSAAANDRKSRLAHLKSLKRKQAPADDDDEVVSTTDVTITSTSLAVTSPQDNESNHVTKTYLSGRNYDPDARQAKLGFESAPIGDQTKTLEYKAEQLALESKKQQAEEEKENRPLDLFKLQPKKPNWDLKRDLGERTRMLHVGTENAIARIVRERVEGQKQARAVKQSGEVDGEKQEVGMEGSELVEVMHLKEREEEEERKRAAEDEDEDDS
jgi:coiled-coil domain-containing protein 12